MPNRSEGEECNVQSFLRQIFREKTCIIWEHSFSDIDLLQSVLTPAMHFLRDWGWCIDRKIPLPSHRDRHCLGDAADIFSGVQFWVYDIEGDTVLGGKYEYWSDAIRNAKWNASSDRKLLKTYTINQHCRLVIKLPVISCVLLRKTSLYILIVHVSNYLT